MRVSNFPVTNVTIQKHKEVIYQAISNPIMRVSNKTSYQVSIMTSEVVVVVIQILTLPDSDTD